MGNPCLTLTTRDVYGWTILVPVFHGKSFEWKHIRIADLEEYIHQGYRVVEHVCGVDREDMITLAVYTFLEQTLSETHARKLFDLFIEFELSEDGKMGNIHFQSWNRFDPRKRTMYIAPHTHLVVNLVHCDTAHVQVASIDVHDSIDSMNIEERMIKIPEIFVFEQVVAWYRETRPDDSCATIDHNLITGAKSFYKSPIFLSS